MFREKPRGKFAQHFMENKKETGFEEGEREMHECSARGRFPPVVSMSGLWSCGASSVDFRYRGKVIHEKTEEDFLPPFGGSR